MPTIVFNPRPTADPQLNEIQRDLQLVIREIARALRLGPLGEPVTLITGKHTVTDETFIEYAGTGGAGQDLILHSAQAGEGRTARALFVHNSGPGTLTLRARAGQTVNAAASVNLTTGQRAVIWGNGATKMVAVIA